MVDVGVTNPKGNDGTSDVAKPDKNDPFSKKGNPKGEDPQSGKVGSNKDIGGETTLDKSKKTVGDADPNNPQDVLKAEFAAFGDFKSAIGLNDTGKKIQAAFKQARPDTRSTVLPWECQIGASKFFVPPLNINVRQRFKTGTLAGGTIRQPSPPKYNSGHLETAISMKLYFPTSDEIWGFPGGQITINFDTATDEVVDRFLSSLRGLIVQFKYAPFLPVRNAYLNGTYDITGVVMESMTVATVPGFPFCLEVQLNMLHFNHEVFLPMVDHFEDAVHWGRLRQYLGKAAITMEKSANKNFLTMDSRSNYDDLTTVDNITKKVRDQLKKNHIQAPIQTFDKGYDWLNGKDFDFYYPDHDPARVVGPDLTDFNSNRDPESVNAPQAQKSWWEQLISLTGFDINTNPFSQFDQASTNADALSGRGTKAIDTMLAREYTLLSAWLKRINLITSKMGAGELEEYLQYRIKKDLPKNASDNTRREFEQRIKAAWFAAMYNAFLADPYLQNVLDYQARKRGWLSILEWEIPMRKLGLNPQNVIVNSVSVSMANNLARLQVQLQDRPVYQHLGGLESRCEISLTVFGEDDLLALRRMFEVVTGLARIEHGHAIIGFLGLKNVITALCGIKYVLPIDWTIDSIDGFPHVYSVTLTLTDFDVFQQKRELLSSSQQADLIEAFSKRNPFLRIKQQWGIFNAYPDMPLDVRDEGGNIIGHFDPDYYFKAFKSIDDDLPKWREQNKDPKAPADHRLEVNFGRLSSTGLSQKISLTSRGMDVHSGDKLLGVDLKYQEPFLATLKDKPNTPGLSPPSEHTHPYLDKLSDPGGQMDGMLKDLQYRDKSGRMIRAFPTYMLWLIDEGGTFAGVKLFDNFYGLQSVVDMSIMQSEDILGDTLVLRVSNLYGRLSTKYRDLLDEDIYKNAKLYNTQINRTRNLASGLSDYLVKLDTVDLRPGTRVHLRLGYSANPNALETVFNGTITEVEQGDIITIIAQSDAIELGAVVNGSDKNATTGDIDGAMMSGLWMSEPRDLMIRLLSMGASGFKENIANATRGVIFSENRFGIRHFGHMLYDPMSEDEERLANARSDHLDKLMSGFSTDPKSWIGASVGFINGGAWDLIQNLWGNFHRRKDYEIFKRNIYPGNGLGIAQYLGGDLGDGGIASGLQPTGVDADSALKDAKTGEQIPINAQDPRDILGAAKKSLKDSAASGDGFATSPANPHTPMNSLVGTHPFLDALGITRRQGIEDDLFGFDEVSFRAQTYMKTVWDLFQICAGLLPNYIVAVRPFEDRSTVFYGKPHWTYTSGVIPLSTGIDPSHAPPISLPDTQLSGIVKGLEEQVASKETPEQFYERLIGTADGTTGAAKTSDPNSTIAGIQWLGEDIDRLALTHPSLNIQIPTRTGPAVRGLHLPTSAVLAQDITQHKQAKNILPAYWLHPYYMDRDTGEGDKLNLVDVTHLKSEGDGTDGKKNVLGETGPGRLPDSGAVAPVAIEEFYVAMTWDYGAGGKSNYYTGANRVLVFDKRTKKGVVCAIADRTPHALAGSIVVSPETWVLLGAVDGDILQVGFVDDAYQLGPVTKDKSNQFDTGKGFNNPTSSKISKSGLPDFMGAHPEYTKQTTDPEKFSLKFGWFMTEVLVDFTDPENGFVDPVGKASEEVFKGSDRGSGTDGEADANQIWDDFRRTAYLDDQYNKMFNEYFPQFSVSNDFLKGPATGAHINGLNKNQKKYQDTIDLWLQFMWQNPYHRGWIVKTADAKAALGGDALDLGKDLLGRDFKDVPVLGDVANFHFTDPISSIDSIFGGSNVSGNWEFDRAHKLFLVWITQGNQAAISWMISNSSGGRSARGVIGRTISDIQRHIWDPIFGFLKDAVGGIGTVITGILSLLRLNTMTLTLGAGMAGFQQRQSNYLNRAFNDSIYFNTKYGVGSLLYLADNPFTREYAEPVVEVRQPFQRMHMLNSFQHILNNRVKENLDGVATIVTATSNNDHPVTMYFDKGAPTERQKELRIETFLSWDSPNGLLGNILHPVNALRNIFQIAEGQPIELLAKRIALYHLKQSLQNIYNGEIVILGDPTIRPFDLVYLGDAYEQMYGMVEVEQVVHHFTPEMGFVTSITPNALVTINDPMRWSLIATAKSLFQNHQIRNKLRQTLSVKAGKSIYGLPSTVDYNSMVNNLETEIKGHVQYTGGMTGLVKDIQGASNLGMLGGLVPGGGALSLIAGAGAGIFQWEAGKYVTEHLIDQHGCYIQYLNHNGAPMDAGLSYNNGVAVGRQHISTLFANSLRIPISINKNGQSRITTNELLGNLGWGTQQLDYLVQDVDYWNNYVNDQILKLSNRLPSGLPLVKIDAKIVTVTRAIDGQSFEVKEKDIAPNGVRLAGIVAPVATTDKISPTLEQTDAGVAALRFLKKRLIDDPREAGFTPTVALRISPSEPTDKVGRVVAWVFHNVPANINPTAPVDASGKSPSQLRTAKLKEFAETWPQIEWDTYLGDGRPYTFNWESVLRGKTNIDRALFSLSISGEGVSGGR